MTTKIRKHASGWWAKYVDEGMRWYINAPNSTNSYATYTEESGIVRALRTAVTSGAQARPLGRVDNVDDALIVARAAYRLSRNEEW